MSKVWNVVRAFRSPVAQLHPFRYLAVYRNVAEISIAEEFCAVLARASPAVNTDLYKDSLASARTLIQEAMISDSPDLDEDFTLGELSAALTSIRHRTAPGTDGVPYSAFCNLGRSNTSRLLEI